MRQLEDKWTAAQREAIRSRGETLLVSAAAGSGKTAVLTERIIDRIFDEEQALELSSVLVVTFTRAAAAELKTRIREALDQELMKNPGNRRLQSQLLAVGQAKICTIDSFLFDLLRGHFELLDISPQVSISDEAQANLLCKTVMNALIDDYFDGTITEEADKIEAFGKFTEVFTTARAQESLAEVFLSLRRSLNGCEDGIEWLKQYEETLHGASTDFLSADRSVSYPIQKKLRTFSDEYLPRYRDAVSFLQSEDIYAKNYGDCFAYECAWLEKLSALLEEFADYETIRTHIQSFSAPGLKSGIRGDKKTADIIAVKALHDAFRAVYGKLKENIFVMPWVDVQQIIAAQTTIVQDLYRLLRLFERRLWNEKQRRQILDFDDLSRLALRLLWNRETDGPTETALAVSETYTEIYIDEYQDVSPIQDRIFRLLSKEQNRFMVGDVKQSIYGFRGASPEIFMGYRSVFSESPACGRMIHLSSNFRCDPQIIAFTNTVFSVLFGADGSEVPYTEADALVCAKQPEGSATQEKVVVALLGTRQEETTEEMTPVFVEEADMAGVGYTEAAWIADQISALLKTGTRRNGERLRPRDIAILLRSTKTAAEPIADALAKRKIPSYNTVTRAFFENAEVALMYSLLSVIDNPQRDVQLAGALKSPLYDVTLDELIYMRQTCPEGSLYDALTAFVSETGFQKGRYFLDRLAYYRHLAAGMPVDRFLWYLYEDTGILSMVYAKEKLDQFGEDTDSGQMRANLMMLYEYARAFEGGAFRGLYQFVLFISDVIEEKAKLPPVQLAGEDADAVRIMTIHQSKGLEFPVCFLAGLDKKHNDADKKKAILWDRQVGLATWISSDVGLARIDHPLRESLKLALAEKQANEEMRILYVALTRAREQLYLSASVPDLQKCLQRAEDTAALHSASMLREMPSMIDWILTAMAERPAFDGWTMVQPEIPTQASEPALHAPVPEQKREPGPSEISYAAAKRLIQERLSFVYRDTVQTELPAKLAVSDYLRMQQKETADTLPQAAKGTLRPQFILEQSAQHEEGATCSAAERGTATHIFMQFCDYQKFWENGAEQEIARLVQCGLIRPETAAIIDRAALQTFYDSTLFARLRRAGDIQREMRFNLQVPAKHIQEAAAQAEDVKILVQGVIDCYFRDEIGRLVLLDYKTDHFSRRQLETPAEVERILQARHRAQLEIYRDACVQLTGQMVDEIRIYSFSLGYDFLIL